MIDKHTVSVTKLYRDCLRLVDYLASKQGGNRAALTEQVRLSFRRNVGETNPEKILEQKEAAIRGLSNYMFFEAQRMAKEEVENSGGPRQI